MSSAHLVSVGLLLSLAGCMNLDAPTACALGTASCDDGGTGDSSAGDTRTDDASDTALDTADSSSDVDSSADVPAESGDSSPADSSDAGDTADTCTINACGACAAEVSPLPGAKCGICLTKKYTCTSSMLGTECLSPDDRSVFTDTYFSAAGGASLGLPAGLAFTALHLGSITSVKLSLLRTDPSPSSSAGSLRIRIIKGKPTTTVAPSDVLADFSVPSTSIPTTSGITTLDLPTPTDNLPLGTEAWLELTDVSPRSNFSVEGDFAPSGVMPVFWAFSAGKYELFDAAAPYLVVNVKGCP